MKLSQIFKNDSSTLIDLKQVIGLRLEEGEYPKHVPASQYGGGYDRTLKRWRVHVLLVGGQSVSTAWFKEKVAAVSSFKDARKKVEKL